MRSLAFTALLAALALTPAATFAGEGCSIDPQSQPTPTAQTDVKPQEVAKAPAPPVAGGQPLASQTPTK